MDIRDARPEDADAIRAVHTQAVERLCSADYSAAEISGWVGARAVRGGWSTKGTRVVATEGGAVVGFAALVEDEIHAVYVHPEHARRGVGSALLEHLETAAAACDVRALHLSSSLTAVPFYTAHGYQRVCDSTHTLRSGVVIRCVEMVKELPGGSR